MPFDLLAFLQRLLGGLNVDGIETRVQGWMQQKAAEYPDLKERADALAQFLTTTLEELAPDLDPAEMALTIKGIASDIVRGEAGVDLGAWLGGA